MKNIFNYTFSNACQEMKVSERLEMIQIGIPRSTIFLSVEESVENNCHLIAHQKKESPSYIHQKRYHTKMPL